MFAGMEFRAVDDGTNVGGIIVEGETIVVDRSTLYYSRKNEKRLMAALKAHPSISWGPFDGNPLE